MVDENITSALPDYAVEREIGKGGMGLVFLGRHVRLGRMVAIKELPPTFAADVRVRERFSTEARTLATLSHPHNSGPRSTRPWLPMQSPESSIRKAT